MYEYACPDGPERANGQIAVTKANQPAEKKKTPRAPAPVLLPIAQLRYFLLPLISGTVHRDILDDIIPLIA